MGKSLVSNPPYNMKWEPPALAGLMPQYQGREIPPKSNANFAFILAGLSKIDRKAVFLLPNGCLSSNLKEEKSIREELIEDNLIEAVITLPDSMFESTSIPVCILVFNKEKETTRIEMIDMRQRYETETRDQNGQYGGNSHTGRTYHKEVKVITEAEQLAAIEAIEKQSSVSGYCRAVLPEEIKEKDYTLVPSRYIAFEEREENHRSFDDIAADYNRIINTKNEIQIKMNKTAAKRLGFDCMDREAPDLTKSFAVVGQKAEKEKHISFTASDGIEIKCSTKDGIPELVMMFLNVWKQKVIYLNNEENRILAELRDALIPELLSGRIEIQDEEAEE